MGCSLFASYHIQMGVTITGFAEHFGPYLLSRAQINFNFFRHYERHVMLAISKEPTDYFGYQDELRHLIGYNSSSSSNSIDCCPRILGAGMKILLLKTITNSLLYQNYFFILFRITFYCLHTFGICSFMVEGSLQASCQSHASSRHQIARALESPTSLWPWQ